MSQTDPWADQVCKDLWRTIDDVKSLLRQHSAGKDKCDCLICEEVSGLLFNVQRSETALVSSLPVSRSMQRRWAKERRLGL